MPNPQMFVKMVANGQQADINVVGGDDLVSWALGDDSDVVFFLRTTTLAADTALSVDSDDVLVGTPVTEALAADSLIISNVTASGDILIAANRGGNSEEYVKVDSSAGALYLSGYQGGTMLALAANPPAPDQSVVHIWGGSAGEVDAGSDAILVAENSAPATIQLLTPNNSYSAIYFSDPDASAGQILYDHSNVRFNIAIEASNRLLWTTSEMAFQQAQTLSTSTGHLTLSAATGADVLMGDNANLLQLNGGNGHIVFGPAQDISNAQIYNDIVAETAPANTSFYRFHLQDFGAVTVPSGTTGEVVTALIGEPIITATGTVTASASLKIPSMATEGGINLGFWGDGLQNWLLGTTAIDHGTTIGTNVLSLSEGTAPAGTLSGAGSLYTDTATNVELNYIDSAGNAQQLSTT